MSILRHTTPDGRIKVKVAGGGCNPELVKDVVRNLNDFDGISCEGGLVKKKKFPNGEFLFEIQRNVRGQHVFFIQGGGRPVNENTIAIFLGNDTFTRSSASAITNIIPMFPFARQDRKTKSGVGISCASIANLIPKSGNVQCVCMIDLHCGQAQGFFSPPTIVDNLTALNLLCDNLVETAKLKKQICIISPDAGGVERADRFRRYMIGAYEGYDAKMAVFNKYREAPGVVKKMELVGAHNVKGADCIIVDDMADTLGTLCKAAGMLKEAGASRVFACVTHGLFNLDAHKKLKESALVTLYTTNTVMQAEETRKCSKVKIVSVAGLIAEYIRRITVGERIGGMFEPKKKWGIDGKSQRKEEEKKKKEKTKKK